MSTYSLLSSEMKKLVKTKKPESTDKSSTSNSSDSGKKNDINSAKKFNKNPNIPDRSFGDYYCTICDSHMNSENMWEAHVTGKRHLKTLMKGDPDSKYEDLNVESVIKYEIRNVKDPIIGLSYIHEIRRREPNVPSVYNCFLCHASLPSVPLVIEHVISLKHRLNFLKEKDPPEYQLIEATNLKKGHLEPLLHEAAIKMEQKYGRGEVLVKIEKPKNTLPVKRTFQNDGEDDVADYHQKPVKNLKSDKNEPYAWKAVDSLRMHDSKRERSPNDKKKASHRSDDDRSAKDIYKRSADNKKDVERTHRDEFYLQSKKRLESESYKKDISPYRDEFYPRSKKRLESDGYPRRLDYDKDSDSCKRDYYDKKHSKCTEYESKTSYSRELMRKSERTRSPSPEHYSKTSSYESESHLLPHEKTNEKRSSLSDNSELKDFVQKILSIQTEVFFKIVLLKMESVELKGIEELSLLTKIIHKGQDLVCNQLPPELQALMKQKIQAATAAVSSPFPAPTPTVPVAATAIADTSASRSGEFKGDTNKPSNLQSNISFIKDILKDVMAVNTPSSVQQHTQQYSSLPAFHGQTPQYNNGMPSFNQNTQYLNSQPVVNQSGSSSQYLNSQPGINQSGSSSHYLNSQPGVNQSGSSSQYINSYQSFNSNPPKTATYNMDTRIPPQIAAPKPQENYSYGNQSGIPGLTLSETGNQEPKPYSKNSYQSAYPQPDAKQNYYGY